MGDEWGVGPEPVKGAHRIVQSETVGQGPRGHNFFGYQATNKCCRDWLLLGWPSDPDGRPVHRDATRDPVLGIDCPKCGRMIYFKISDPDLTTTLEHPEEAQPAALVGGRFRVG